MNLKEIKEMINIMNENDLTEIEIEKDGTKIKLKKALSEAHETIFNRPVEPHMPVPLPAKSSSQLQPASVANRKEIKSPMVGTFYRAASPETPAFVEVGQTVEVGQVVCIVEAMKLMNEIKSEIRGKVTEIAVENAQAVEFGQTLFVIEPL